MVGARPSKLGALTLSIRISVVVTEHEGDVAALSRCLAGIARASAPDEVPEVVVAGPSGLVRRVSLLDSGAELGPAKKSEAAGPAWRSTSGDLVAFLSSRAVPEDHWLDALRRGFESRARNKRIRWRYRAFVPP